MKRIGILAAGAVALIPKTRPAADAVQPAGEQEAASARA